MIFYNVSKFWESTYRQDLIVKITFGAGLFLNLAMWALLFWKISPLSYLNDSGQIYLHYNIYFGIDKIGDWYQVFIIPATGLFFMIFNNILAYIFYLKEKLISNILIISQLALQIVLLAATIFVVLLNI